MQFDIEEELLKGHQKQYKVSLIIDDVLVGKGLDVSKKRAEQQAAHKACEYFNIL